MVTRLRSLVLPAVSRGVLSGARLRVSSSVPDRTAPCGRRHHRGRCDVVAVAPRTGLTPAGKVVVTIIVVALVGMGVWFLRDTLFPKGETASREVDMARLQGQLSGQRTAGPEAPDLGGVTTVSEYEYVPAEKLPPVKGTGAYKWNQADPTVVFPINVWIGWLPIVAANHGFAPNTDSIFYKNYGFKVELKLIDDPVAARDAFAAGESHILWGTLDMIALFAPELMRDSRTAPRVYQQIDWSNGGDGIVVRSHIKTVADLRGKTIVYAQNSPSEYYFNTLLIAAGIQPREVSVRYTNTAFEASAAYAREASLDGCVSWAPDIYKITDADPASHLLSTTADASKVIADVWAARADFARDHPQVIRGLVEGIFTAMEQLEKDEQFKAQAVKWIAEGYNMPAADIEDMLQDAHSTNFAENVAFFLNRNNPTNFERTWANINAVYGELKKIEKPVPFDQVMDFSVIKALKDEGKFAHQQDTYTATFVPSDWQKIAEAPVLTQVIRIHFPPNVADVRAPLLDASGKAVPGKYYDPNVNETLERVARLAGQYDRAVIKITGHTDDSMRGQVDKSLVQKLSDDRANAVRTELIKKYGFDEDKFRAEGKAWDVPADRNDPRNHAKNRRVEIAVYPLEQQ